MSESWIIVCRAKVHLRLSGTAHRVWCHWSCNVKYMIRIALTAVSIATIQPVASGDTLDHSPPALQRAAFAAPAN